MKPLYTLLFLSLISLNASFSQNQKSALQLKYEAFTSSKSYHEFISSAQPLIEEPDFMIATSYITMEDLETEKKLTDWLKINFASVKYNSAHDALDAWQHTKKLYQRAYTENRDFFNELKQAEMYALADIITGPEPSETEDYCTNLCSQTSFGVYSSAAINYESALKFREPEKHAFAWVVFMFKKRMADNSRELCILGCNE